MTAKELRIKAQILSQHEKRIKLLTNIQKNLEKLAHFKGSCDIDEILQSMSDNFSDSFYNALLKQIEHLKEWD